MTNVALGVCSSCQIVKALDPPDKATDRISWALEMCPVCRTKQTFIGLHADKATGHFVSNTGLQPKDSIGKTGEGTPKV